VLGLTAGSGGAAMAQRAGVTYPASAPPHDRRWADAQTALTEAYLGRDPRRPEIATRLARTAGFLRVDPPRRGGERLFFLQQAATDPQPVLYVQDRADTPVRVLVDPAALARDGSVSIAQYQPSPDGRLVAYGVSVHGSIWRRVLVRDVRTRQDLDDELRGITDAPLAWTLDARGFFYIRTDSLPAAAPGTPAREGRQRLYYHRTGHAQSDDDLIFEDPSHPGVRLRADVSADGQYLVIALGAPGESKNRMAFIDLDNPKRPNLRAPLVTLFDTADALYEFVANEGPIFFIRTTQGATRTRVVAVDINAPSERHWTTILPETYDPLIAVRRVDDRFVALRLRDGRSVLEVDALDGQPRGTVALPSDGTVEGLSGRASDRELYFTFSSTLQRPTTFRFDLDTQTSFPFRDVPPDSALEGFETTRLYFTSADGTRIPMSVTARRGMTLAGNEPTLLDVDGVFGRANVPRYSPFVSTWLQHGGIYAVPEVRDARDLVAAAEFLIGQRYTQPAQLGLTAHGAAGSIAGAALVQRPDLFGAAAIDGGVFAPARAAADSARPPQRFPPTLLTAGEWDDRVPAAESYEFAAALQAALAPNAGPVLLRADPATGPSFSAPLARQLAADADRLTFLIGALRKH
jgi:prolyl oligopeptidase